MKLTDWFYGTTPPVRPGVYETRVRGATGEIMRGYSKWCGNCWSYTHETIAAAGWTQAKSGQYSKEWRGLAEEPK
jgi:hypothetical protein